MHYDRSKQTFFKGICTTNVLTIKVSSANYSSNFCVFLELEVAFQWFESFTHLVECVGRFSSLTWKFEVSSKATTSNQL